jgi:hypothetical protein
MSIQRLSNAGQSGFRYKSLIAGITPVASVPVIGEATALTYSTASVTFTAPGAYAGSTYTATSSPGGFTGTSASSPITVSGLSGETAYTFTVTATNATGTSGPSAASNSITTPAEWSPLGAYDALATVTLSEATSTVTFTGIPSGYKHLQIRAIGRTNRTNYSVEQVRMRLNSDSGSNYATHQLGGDGATPYSFTPGTSSTFMLVGQIGTSIAGTNTSGAFVTDILDYASTDKNRTIRTLAGVDPSATISGTVYGAVTFSSGVWMNSTTPISSITLSTELSGNFTSGSFALYGVK